tara:strand:- start:112 stop:345 length:234 start_codon:yes stop_codon:yes gene_type:complete
MENSQLNDRPSLNFAESQLLDSNYCYEESNKSNLFYFINKNYCLNSSLFEIYDYLNGKVSDSSFLYDKSIIRQWALN